MSSITINRFRGQASRDQRLIKPNVFAECAINASLQDGALSAIPCPEEFFTSGVDNNTIYESDFCGVFSFPDYDYIDTYQGNIYKTQGNTAKRFSDAGICESSEALNVGMPTPTQPPTVSAGVSAGGRFEPRQYMYTFVSKRGDCVVESPPSPISRSANCADVASIANLQVPPAGWGITDLRIYRFDAGWKSGSEANVQNNSGALMVAEIAAGSTSYSDGNPLSDPDMIGLLTYDMETMPFNPQGLGATAFSMFSWVNKELYISADGMPELRRKNGRFCFDHDIISAKYWDGSIYVFTERYNYRIDERAGEGGVSYSNPPFRFEKIMPLASEYSVSVGSSGVFFHTAAGIGVLSGNANALVGTGILNTSQWKSYKSDNIRTFVYQQYLFIFSEDWSFTHIYEFEDGVAEDREYSNHVLYPYSISAMHIGNDGQLYFGSGDSVYIFMEQSGCPDFCFDEQRVPICQECCPYDYRIMPRHDVKITDYSHGYLRIDPQYGDVTFRLWDRACGKDLVYEATFGGCGEHQFRLPAGCLSEEHFIQLEGCAKVYELRIGTSAKDVGLNR